MISTIKSSCNNFQSRLTETFQRQQMMNSSSELYISECRAATWSNCTDLWQRLDLASSRSTRWWAWWFCQQYQHECWGFRTLSVWAEWGTGQAKRIVHCFIALFRQKIDQNQKFQDFRIVYDLDTSDYQVNYQDDYASHSGWIFPLTVC